jgi:DNA-binding NarL/FixJ family response regulator
MTVFDTDDNFVDEDPTTRSIIEFSKGKQTANENRAAGPVVLVHQRALDRECIARSLQAYDPTLEIAAVGHLNEAIALPGPSLPEAILWILGGRSATDQQVRTELQDCKLQLDSVPVIVVADSDEPGDVVAAIDAGADGYVSTNEGVNVLAKAIALAIAGGMFVPTSCIMRLKGVIGTTQASGSTLSGMFTGRQTQVANALKQGKPNKIIAYELNMCEATVKVHVRNIMKKLKATNRTEVAYKLTEMAA